MRAGSSFLPGLIVVLLSMNLWFIACNDTSRNVTFSDFSDGTQTESAQRAVQDADAMPTIQAKPEWFVCQRDQDCMAVEGVCNSENAVNRYFRGPFMQYRNTMNRQLACKAPPTISNAGTEVGCIKNRCVVNPRQLKQPNTRSTNWPADNPNLHPD